MTIDLKPGVEPLPGYQLISRLGKGGFGEVWKAAAPGGFKVALKFVPLEEASSKVEMRSLEVIKDIRHANLLSTFGAWQVNDMLIIAMELADRTLLDRLREATAQGQPGIPGQELLEYFAEAAKGIDYLNEPRLVPGTNETLGIQHRDIKPQNLLLAGGSIKVADFGLARVLQHSITAHTGSLTLTYAAPEFFSGQTSNQSDQYSLAVTYCQLRGGRLPFTGSAAEIMAGHLNRDPDLNMLPETERPIVKRAMSKEPKRRWPTCREFVRQLRISSGLTELAPTMAAASASSSGSPAVQSTQRWETGVPHGQPAPAIAVMPAVDATVRPSDWETKKVQAVETPTESGGPAAGPAWRKSEPLAIKRRRTWFWPAALVLLLAAAGVGLWQAGIFTPPPPPAKLPTPLVATFSLDVPAKIVVKPGASKSIVIGLKREAFRGPVRVSFEGLPAQASVAPINVAADREIAEAILNADKKIKAGSYDIKVTATGADVRQEAVAKLVIEKVVGSLKLLPPASVAVKAGGKQTFEIKVQRKDIDEPVTVTFGKVDKLTLPEVVIQAGKDSAPATLQAAADAPAGAKSIKVTAQAGEVREESTFSFVVQKAPRLALAILGPLDFQAGEESTIKIKVDREEIDGPVTLKIDDSSPGFKIDGGAQIPADASETELRIRVSSKLAEGPEEVKKDLRIVGGLGALTATAKATVSIKPWIVGPIGTLDGHSDEVKSVAFTPDGARAISGGRDESVRLWDLASAKEVFSFDQHGDEVNCVAVSADGSKALSGSDDLTVRIWDLADKKSLGVLKGNTEYVASVAISPDGKSALSGSYNSVVILWDLESKKETRRWKGKDDKAVFHSVIFSPDDKQIAAGSSGNAIFVWSRDSDKELAILKVPGDEADIQFYSIAFSADGARILAASSDKLIRLFDSKTGEIAQTFEGHADEVRSVAFAPDGKSILSGSSDKTVRTWDVATGKEIKRFDGHTAGVTSVAFSPDGRRAISGSLDKAIRIWRLPLRDE